MENKYRVVIVEDHTIIREGLRSLLASTKEFEVVDEAGDGHAAIRIIGKARPDLVLTDLSMPKMDGIDMIETIKKESPHTKVVALTVHRAEEYFRATLKAGADGYVLKDASYVELLLAIRNVMKGRQYVSPEISGTLIDGYLGSKKAIHTDSPWEILTKRERQILKLIAEGYKAREIADFLHISLHTVETHRANLMKKLDLHNTASLVAFAMGKGLVGNEKMLARKPSTRRQ